MREDLLVNRAVSPGQSKELKVVEANQRKVWASHHRFGPSLICQHGGCTQTWYTQQDHPTTCEYVGKEGLEKYWGDQAQSQREAFLGKEVRWKG